MTKTEILDNLYDATKNNTIKAGIASDVEWEEDGTYAGQMRFIQVPVKGCSDKYHPYIIQTIRYSDVTIIRITCLSHIENTINIRVGQGWSVQGTAFNQPTGIIQKVRDIIKSPYGLDINKRI